MAIAVYRDPGFMWVDEDAILAEADDRMALGASEEFLAVSDDGIVVWSAAALDDDSF